jgi:hypothetical protein
MYMSNVIIELAKNVIPRTHSFTSRVGQNHTYTRIYGEYAVF